MINAHSRAYTDICYILSMLEEKYKKQIPDELIRFFKENSDTEYLPKIDFSRPLTEQELSQETEQLICLLNLNYWCTPEEKEELLKKYKINEKEAEEQLHNKYEIKFDKNFQIEDVKAIAVIEKESILKKIIRYIKEAIMKKK